MCVIIVVEKGKKISKETHNKAWENNSDGLGVMYYEAGKLVTKKGIMKQNDAWEAIQVLNKANRNFVIHYRMASVGGVKPELTHPFYCGKDMALMHNGHVTNWHEYQLMLGIVNRKAFDMESDTQVIAGLVERVGVNSLKVFSGQKFVLASEGKFRVIGNFTKHEGLICSNTYFLHSFRNSLYDDDYFRISRGRF